MTRSSACSGRHSQAGSATSAGSRTRTSFSSVAPSWRGPERYSRPASELVSLRPDIIVSGVGEPGALALRKATTTIPIVMLVAADPVGTGLVASLARPGGNVTGMSLLAPELGGKRLEILKEAVAKATRVAVLWNAAYPGKATELKDSEATARLLKVTLHPVEVRGRWTRS